MLIEICGGIASGKTTLCKSISALGGFAVHEDFQKNPFLESFYKNPKPFSFETEITFLLQHYHSIKISSKQFPLVCDFSLVQDGAYADLNLAGDRHRIFSDIEHNLRAEIGFPDLLIHIKCPANVLLARIHSRNRAVEKNISIEYLDALDQAINIRVKNCKDRVRSLEIDSNRSDFRSTLSELNELKPFLANISDY